MKKSLAVAVFSVFALAAAQKTQTVYINGQPVQAVSVSVGGQPALQILTSDLQKIGALTQGGSKPVDAIQGCPGQTLFNGVTRITLLSAQAGQNKSSNDPEYQIKLRVVNGTNGVLNPRGDAGIYSDNFWLADETGQVMKMSNWIEGMEGYDELLPGSNSTIGIMGQVPSFKPTRVIWRPTGVKEELPWAKVRNMEFKLQCK